MSEKIYAVPADWKKRAFADDAKYQEMYARSVNDPNGFWAEEAKRIDWIKPPTKVKNTSFDPHNVSIKWFEDGTLNVAYNCIDRHLAKRGDQTAITLGRRRSQGRQEDHLQAAACARSASFANVLKARGVKKGDRVTIYMPMILEAAVCHAGLRPHRRHSFGGVRRLLAGLARRPHRPTASRTSSSPPTKASAAAARFRSRPKPTPPAKSVGHVNTVIVVRHTGGKVNMQDGPRRLLRRDRQDGAGRMPVRGQ